MARKEVEEICKTDFIQNVSRKTLLFYKGSAPV